MPWTIIYEVSNGRDRVRRHSLSNHAHPAANPVTATAFHPVSSHQNGGSDHVGKDYHEHLWIPAVRGRHSGVQTVDIAVVTMDGPVRLHQHQPGQILRPRD